jgi:hypothetical protein
MDYKHIESLLERYWQCETSLSEEQQLRDFFTEGDVPAHLLPYKELFAYQTIQPKLGDDFDNKIMAAIEPKVVVKARRISLTQRLAPLYKAAAVVVVLLLSGNLVKNAMLDDTPLEYDYDSYVDTYDDPEVAYREVSSALMMVSESMNMSNELLPADSLRSECADSVYAE